ncbi:MAG: tetratricopeptide repeat protein, partial [Acidobacteria bacterium]|nr:tetratricopeptide repeat protein [Acidobacteriota bacterium]
MEFEAELERSAPPGLKDDTADSSGGNAIAETVKQPWTYPALSAKHIFTSIKRHKGVALVALITLMVAATALFIYYNRAPALTEKDTILLADFVNTTGDPVFDETLKLALAVYLGQSPYLNIFPNERVRETLRYMGRAPDERVTREIAREVCQRHGIKAMLIGSISPLGNHYVIGLEAVNAQTGEALAREQVEAESKEQVLRRLGEAATSLRRRLGESLRTIERFDAPLEQATTSSLDALKAFSQGDELRTKGRHLESIPFFRRAVELDPDFALAYAKLAVTYSNLGEFDLAAQSAQRAFVRGYGYFAEGQFEKAIEELSEAIRLDPARSLPYSNLASALVGLNRFEEAKEFLERAIAQQRETVNMHRTLYWIAFVRGDSAGMQRELDWIAGKPDEYQAFHWQARTASFSGQVRQAREFSRRAIDLAMRRNMNEVAAEYASWDALWDAVFGDCRRVKEDVTRALTIARSHAALDNGARALALCGEVSQAQSLADELVGRNPRATRADDIWLPQFRATVELHRGNLDQVIQLSQTRPPHDWGNSFGASFWPNYLRGQAYLRQRAGTEAMAEFQN